MQDEAPTRAILCAGGGHFARANITLSQGVRIGDGENAGQALIAAWDQASDRSGEAVPAYGFQQAEQELASAGAVGPVMARA
ncbi:hypothetical protein D3C85_783310 [compost metagenome]